MSVSGPLDVSKPSVLRPRRTVGTPMGLSPESPPSDKTLFEPAKMRQTDTTNRNVVRGLPVGIYLLAALAASCSAGDTGTAAARCDLTDEDCEPDWDAIASEAGFATHPRASFFEFAQFACEYEPLPPPQNIDSLIEMSSPIVIGTITSIEPIVRYPLNEGTPYYVYMGIEVTDTLVGQAPSTMLVSEPCSHAAKVAGLRRLLPGDPLLFLLGGPFERPMLPAYYELQYYGLGIVGERDGRVAFEHHWNSDAAPPSLEQFGSLDELANHVRARAAAAPTEDP